MNQNIKKKLYELIVEASTKLPTDIENALKKGLENEEKNSPSSAILSSILENCQLANERSLPICQDTGTLIINVSVPEDKIFSQRQFIENMSSAIEEATENCILRQNSVCPISGVNTGDNLGPGTPVYHFHQTTGNEVKVQLMLKGGGSENVGIQYALPNGELGAGRDLDGVRKCILDSVLKAQGKGCAPGILSVVIGGDRASSFEKSKEQLIRKLGSTNPNKELDEIEKEMFNKINELGIGPLGLGGKTTVLDVFISHLNRVPASYFVTVSYMCWACRRAEFTMSYDEFING